MNLTNSITIITQDNIQILLIENDFASAQIALFGGHILNFKPKHDGRERLWLSEKAIFDGKKAIRGGVPVCWPWFGAHPTNKQLSAHGYVRNQTWEILTCAETDKGTTLSLAPQTTTGDGFAGTAQLTLVVHIGQELNIQLHTTNLGNSDFTYNCALHSYFTISDISQCELIGLTGKYLDKTQAYQSIDTPVPYQFSQEIDRVHLQQPSTLVIKDRANQTEIDSSGHDSIVVWNPWRNKSISLSDMADDSYLSMLCVETAITQGRTLRANETHILEQIIK